MEYRKLSLLSCATSFGSIATFVSLTRRYLCCILTLIYFELLSAEGYVFRCLWSTVGAPRGDFMARFVYLF